MKSLKALENKYILIREAATPPAAPAAPAAAAPATPAVPAAPVDPKVLAALNAPDSPLQPKKIEELSKDPVKLKAYAQNELPKIIDGIVAEIAKTNPTAIPEILAAAKRNDLKTVQELLAKYSKEAASTPAAAPAPAAAPVMSTASYIPNTSNTVTEASWAGFVAGLDKVINWFGKNKFIMYSGLGLALGGPLGALALPLLVSALEKVGGGGKGDGSTNQPETIKKQMDIPPDALTALNGILRGQNPSRHNSLMATGVTIPSFPGGVLTNNEKYLLDNGAVVVATAPDGSVYNIKKDGVNYRITVVAAGANIEKPSDSADSAADKKAADDKAAAITPRTRLKLKGVPDSYTPFVSLSNKVLKEFYENSKSLPIETANKK